ncbi:hypothetical protein [Mycobacterium rhizamassiliense]|uniref:COG4705 family protein n=1 Tax=Mycobacterium rhizamassiliense TaxID=1841860 RepID=UPI00097D3185|nr:hypothetical protein [Mycobacterium rhizamassiliense]
MTEITGSGWQIQRPSLSKVPAVTAWFWIIKILCTTVGESFADWLNITVGLGLNTTALIFTVALAAVMAWQLTLNRYVSSVYWLAVVVFSVAGTLYTDILTDDLHVRLGVSTGVFAVALAVVFGVWFARERTLSIHSIVTLPRELFYWLAVLVTFALGTAAGDLTLELTGWGAGVSVLLPAGLIVAVLIGWRMGANPVLSFWLAYILTRPLGANLGDWLASSPAVHGVGLGTAVTSAAFLAAILVTVVYLTVSRVDVIDRVGQDRNLPAATTLARERVMLGYYAVVAAATVVGLVMWSAGHSKFVMETDDEGGAKPVASTLVPGSASAHFPPAEIAKFRVIAQDTLGKVRGGDQRGARDRITDLETAWDEAEPNLRPMDGAAWSVLDRQTDAALSAVRAGHPDPATETRALNTLLDSLR